MTQCIQKIRIKSMSVGTYVIITPYIQPNFIIVILVVYDNNRYI